jgi:hypothetical protein
MARATGLEPATSGVTGRFFPFPIKVTGTLFGATMYPKSPQSVPLTHFLSPSRPLRFVLDRNQTAAEDLTAE